MWPGIEWPSRFVRARKFRVNKPIHKRAAILSDMPGMFEACLVLESDQHGARPILYEGSLEIAERMMSCWNVQLDIETKHIARRTE